MTDIRELKFSVRTRNLLINADIKTVEQLLSADLDELRREHMFGPVTMAEIDRKIREHTKGVQIDEENDQLLGLLYRTLKNEFPEATRIAKGVAIVMPSGRHVLVRIEG